MSARAVIFDLDGTILDTLDDLTAAIDHALAALGRQVLTRECVRRFVGNGVKKLVSRALGYTDGSEPDSVGFDHAEFDECLRLFTEYYNAHSADKTSVYSGVGELLNALKAEGFMLGVVTNKYDAAAQALKKKFFDCVDIVVGTSDTVKPKPATDGVEKALAVLGAAKTDAVYVGDGETDIATARNAGLTAVAVTWGFRDRALLESLKPDYIIDRPDGLMSVLADLGLLSAAYGGAQ